jgi:hypothetical protein
VLLSEKCTGFCPFNDALIALVWVILIQLARHKDVSVLREVAARALGEKVGQYFDNKAYLSECWSYTPGQQLVD